MATNGDALDVTAREEQCLLGSEASPSIASIQAETYYSTISVHVRLFVTIFTLNLALQLLSPAQTKMYEAILCRKWYDSNPSHDVRPHGPVPEKFCRLSPVQTEISTLNGYYQLFETLPSLLFCLPIGILADRFGRKRLYVLNICMSHCQQLWVAFILFWGGRISLKLVWLVALFASPAAGKAGLELLFSCIVSDVTPVEGQSAFFFRAMAARQVSGVLGPLVASAMLRRNPWYAIVSGLGLQFSMIVLTLTLPETLREARKPLNTSTRGLNRNAIDLATIKTSFMSAQKSLTNTVTLFQNRTLILVTLPLGLRMVFETVNGLVPRYVSNKYLWDFADATSISTVQALGSTVVAATALPQLINRTQRRQADRAQTADLSLVRISLLSLIISFGVQAVAPNVPVYAIGLALEALAIGLAPALRALVGSLVAANQSGKAFSAVAICEILTNTISGPLVALLFNIGLEKGGQWLGIPYYGGSLVALLALTLVGFLKL